MSFTDCARAADMMSCAAMIGMAKAEAKADAVTLDYLVNNPVCERFHTLADRVVEHQLQLDPTTAISRKLCVYKTPQYGTGEWVRMLQPLLPPVKQRFDEQTKQR